MSTEGASSLSPFAGVVLMACLFGRNLTHLHRPDADDNDTDLNGEFWKRHRALDNILLNTSFNENEPIVNSPEQALECFLRTDMDMLVLENCVVTR